MSSNPSASVSASHSRKLCTVFFLSSAAFLLLAALLFYPHYQRKQFQAFCQELFTAEMTANTLSLHYSLAQPETFGIRSYPVYLPCYEAGSELLPDSRPAELLEKLSAFRKKDLSFNDRYAADLLQQRLLLSSKEQSFPYYEEPLSPANGAQSQFPILMAEYAFRAKKDVDEYLSLLSQTGNYFASLLTYEREKASAGLLMSRDGIAKTIKQCDTIVTYKELEAGTHFLQTGFQDRLTALAETSPLTPEESLNYRQENDRILKSILLPAYRELSQGLSELLAYAPQDTCGLACLPLGKEYYTLLLQKQTGSSKTPEEIRTLLTQKLSREIRTLQQLISDYPGCLSNYAQGTYCDLGFSETSAMLEDLKARLQGTFPSLPSSLPLQKIPSATDSNAPFISDAAGSRYPHATIKSVEPNLQEYTAPAYYLTAPIDNTDTNVIYINTKNQMNQLELYTTLAHEGFPGHLYQNAYTAKHLLSLSENRLRQLVSPGGYLEGWALYTEQYSYNFAARRLKEQGRTADAVCVQLEKHHRSLSLCLFSLLDLEIHYNGAQMEDLKDTFRTFGLSVPQNLPALYNYICQSPANYPKYYLGYLEILELKQEAMSLWDTQYSDLAFHRFLLDWGPADFENLRKLLRKYRPV